MSERAPRRAAWLRVLPWLVTAACFAFLYYRIDKPASAAGMSVVPYLIEGFRDVSWSRWLALMVPYSLFYFMIDSLVTWKVINWFNARVRFSDILPIRGSAYILSIVNEQVSKGAMALYLNRRYAIPGWQVGSSMLFIMFCEFYYLLGWATLGILISGESLPEEFRLIPRIAIGAAVLFPLFLLYFNGTWLPGPERARHAKESKNYEEYLTIVYSARSVNAVLTSETGKPYKVRITVDGEFLTEENRGADVTIGPDGESFVLVNKPRLFNIVENPSYVRRARLQMSSNSADFGLFAFTFGVYQKNS